MDELTRLSSEAIVRAVRRSGGSVAEIVSELHEAAVVANRTIGRPEAAQLMCLANAIEIDGELAGG